MIQPILDRIVVRRLPNPTKLIKTDDGNVVEIEIPDQYRQQNRYGTVIAVGHGCSMGMVYFPMNELVSIGDVVYFGEYNAEPFKEGEEELVLLRVQDVRGISKKAVSDGPERGSTTELRASRDDAGQPEQSSSQSSGTGEPAHASVGGFNEALSSYPTGID